MEEKEYLVHVTYLYLRTNKDKTGYFETEFFNVDESNHPILYPLINSGYKKRIQNYIYGLCHELFLSNGEFSGLTAVAFEVPQLDFSVVVRPDRIIGGAVNEG